MRYRERPPYPLCPYCNMIMEPEWYWEEEEERVTYGGHTSFYKTGRKRKQLNYFICMYCGHKENADDETFAGEWIGDKG